MSPQIPSNNYVCAVCKSKMEIVSVQYPVFYCARCEQKPQSEKIKKYRFAYKIYSVLYGPFALLNMWVIWRGSLLPLLRWYRESFQKAQGQSILDIAIGDAELALMSGKKLLRQVQLVALDLSMDMLKKAAVRLRRQESVRYILANVETMPFTENAFDFVSCYGGIHVFQNRASSILALAKVLKKGGIVRGSILTHPRASWAQKICDAYVRWGFLGSSPSVQDVQAEFASAGLSFTQFQMNGHMILFEAQKIG